jgi:uncharacterized protein YciI
MKTFALMLLSAALGIQAVAQSGPFLFVVRNSNPNKPEMTQGQVDSIMAGHMANIGRLAEEGKLLAAGPFHGGGGIFVLATESKDTARMWLSTDPGVRAQRWTIELLPYQPILGSICKVGEKFEMTSYTFLRLTMQGSADRTALRSAMDRLRALVPPDSVVTEGMFPQDGGSILAVRGEWSDSVFQVIPEVRNGAATLVKKKLWIARGAFCER